MTATNLNDMKVVFFGTGDFGLPSLMGLIDGGVKPVGVVTSPDRPAGRGLAMKESAIKKAAVANGIPVYQPEDVNTDEAVKKIREFDGELGIIIAYGQKISGELISVFPKGIINLHASLLPKYRGAAPINWAIIEGEKETGVTVMQINEQIDAGMILNQESIAIDPEIRTDELHDVLAEMGPAILEKTLKQISDGSLEPKVQEAELVSKAPKLSRKKAMIDWNQPAQKIVDFIRGMWSWPTAISEYVPADIPADENGKNRRKPKRITVAFSKAIVLEGTAPEGVTAGTILDDFSIATGNGVIKILELKPSGSKLMRFDDFVNGRRVKPGDMFVSNRGDS